MPVPSDLIRSEWEILQEIAGRKPARKWGAHVGICYESLHAKGYLTSASPGAEMTVKAETALDA